MSWDFRTDPEYQAQLDWVDTFVREEVEPLDMLFPDLQFHPLDATRRAIIDPLKDEVRKRGLWATHLGRWVRGYATLLERVTEHSFYREIARLLRDFSEAELTLLKVRVDDMDGGREVVPKSEIDVLFNPDEPVCGGCDHGKEENRAIA